MLRSGTMAFLAGILALQQFTELPELFWPAALLPCFGLAVYYRSRVFVLLNWLLAGFLWAWLTAGWLLAQALPPELEGKDVTVTGHIATIPARDGRVWRFEYDIDSGVYQGRAVVLPHRVRLSWYGQAPRLAAGDRWRLTVRLKRPHGFMNPGGFDYERWLFTHRIRATGYVRTGGENALLVQDRFDYPLQRARQAIQARLATYLAENPLQGVVAALTIGHREDISQLQWQVFRRTGTSHLVAISGLHIGLVAGLVFFLVRWAWAHTGRLPLRLAAPRAAALAALLAAVIYAALAGWSLPTQRAVIMVAVVMLAMWLRRQVKPADGLSLALLLVLLYDPLAVLSPGFWLSFVAVGLIFLVMQGKRNGVPWWDKWLRVQWVVWLGLLPLVVLFFQQSSLVAPLANLIAVPIVSLLVVPLLLGGLLLCGLFEPLGRVLLEWGAGVLDYLVALLSYLSRPAYANWHAVVPDTLVLAMSLLGMLILLLAPRRTGRWLGVVFLLPILFPQADRPRHGEMQFTLLDVGQGLAAVVQTRHHSLVFDTGPRFNREFDTGSAVVVPFLRHAGIDRVDSLVVSHGDNDHIGGVQSLLAAMPVARVYTSAPALLDKQQGIPCRAGQHWEWDGVSFRLLHPAEADSRQSENNQSCVLAIEGRYGTVLLPGDIEKGAEVQLIQRLAGHLKATVLVAPHHGSKTSSTAEFIAAVRPDVVLFPVGYRNRYRFPYPEVVQRYRQAGIRGYDTARHGAISFRLGADGIESGPDLARVTQRRYWHHKARH